MVSVAFNRVVAAVVAALLIFGLSGCSDMRGDAEISSQTTAGTAADIPAVSPVRTAGEFYGSFLTMYLGSTPPDMRGMPYVKVFHSQEEVENYYDTTYEDFFYGTVFTMSMASFTDEFFESFDMMILVIDEPSSYLNHTADPIEISDDEIKINIVRHIQEDAPMSPTQYHLIFIAPRGSFDGIDGKKLSLEISEVTDTLNTAFDSERYRMYYPEYWNFCYRTDAVTEDPQVVVDAISSYDELVYFFDRYGADFDFESEFRKHVGTLYNMDAFERYVILATIIPCAHEKPEPETTEAFVNNREIYLTIAAEQPEEGEKPEACYLLLTAIERSELQGVHLEWFNLSFADAAE